MRSFDLFSRCFIRLNLCLQRSDGIRLLFLRFEIFDGLIRQIDNQDFLRPFRLNFDGALLPTAQDLLQFHDFNLLPMLKRSLAIRFGNPFIQRREVNFSAIHLPPVVGRSRHAQRCQKQ